MCEGNAERANPEEASDINEVQEPQPPLQRHTRNSRRTRRLVSIDEDTGWDVVPPIRSIRNNSNVWKETNSSTERGKIQYKRSLQHLGTLVVPDTFGPSGTDRATISSLSPPTTISTTPLVLSVNASYYLVAGCHDGTVCLWNLMQLPALEAFRKHRQRHSSFSSRSGMGDGDEHPGTEAMASASLDPLRCIDTLTSIPPLQVIDTCNIKGIRNTVAMAQLCLMPESDITPRNSFAAMNAFGAIYIVSVSVKATMNVIASFETGRLSPTCITCICDSFVIGYQSGFLEAWSMHKTHHEAESATGINIDATTDTSRLLICSSALMWRASFADCTSAPLPAIHSIALLSPDAELSPNTDSHCFLALTLDNNDPERPSTASMLEVVDATSIAHSWIRFLDGNVNALSDRDSAVPLEEHWVLPEVGRDILDSSTIDLSEESRHRPTTNWIPSRATNRLCSVASLDSSIRIAVGLADGTVTVLDSRRNDDGRTQWGASPLIDQFCFSFPCIGMSCVYIAESQQLPIPYLACCLRGSATYLIPLNPSAESEDCASTVFATFVPHSFDEDVSNRYIQEFVACNLVLERQEEESLTDSSNIIPILVYVCPGGVIDVYSYGLLTCNHSFLDGHLIQECISNGSVDTLRNILLNSSSEDIGLQDLWTCAMQEVSRVEKEAPIGVNDLYSDRLDCFRKVLIHFAT